MKYAVNLEPNKRNCFPEYAWLETNNYEILKEEPHNNVLFEHEYEDILWEDLHEVDGEIQLNEEHYNARKQNASVELLRSQRSPLLLAFDMWKSNVSIGFEEADEELLATVKVWYQGIKDLDPEHLNNVPECIQNYL